MSKFKAKFNTKLILEGNTNYGRHFVELVKKYDGKIIEVDEEPFGGYELELEGKTYGLYEEDLIIVGDK